MDINFKNQNLEKVFISEKELSKRFGQENGRLIMRRMMVLKATTFPAEVPHTKPERKHQLTGNRHGKFAVDVKHPFRIVFKPNHKPIPKRDDGGIDEYKITAITILGVEDYH